MTKKLFVGNLAHSLSEEELREIFEQHGTVVSAKIIIDRETGRSRGFGFVEMSTPEEAKTAVERLDGQDAAGRPLRISEAKEQAPSAGGKRFERRGGGDFRSHGDSPRHGGGEGRRHRF